MIQLVSILFWTLNIAISHGGRTCLSCSGVVSVSDCDDVETCRDDEVCFTHKYTTPSKEDQYDFGCSLQKLCVSGSSGAAFGKRVTGHHLVCQTCCNTTTICNMKSSCVNKLGEHSSCISTGNDNIHQISTSTNHRLSIYLEDFTGRFAYANYSVFNVGDEQRKYQLGVYVFTGTHGLGDYLSMYNNKAWFSTKDQDNDYTRANCATYGHAGWWYGQCGAVNLNGPYMAGPVNTEKSMFWGNWPLPSSTYSLKKSTMMIKRSKEMPYL